MAIKKYAGDRYVGLSGDSKPTVVDDGAIFFETDTGKHYIKISAAWTEQVGSSGYSGYSGAVGTSYPWQGAWNSGTGYVLNDCVEYNGSGYVCIQAGTNKVPGVDTAYWDLMTQAGSSGYSGYSGYSGVGASGYSGYSGAGTSGYSGYSGMAGTQYTWKGAWNSGTAYNVNECVQYNSSGYVCIQAGTNKVPGVDTDYWDLLVERGISGYSGVGASGYSGYSGMVGANLDPAPGSDHTANGLQVVLTGGESLVFGNAVYFKSDGKCWKAKADSATTIPCIGLAIATIGAEGTGSILKLGYARDDSWSWTVGGLIYISEATAGLLTQTRPSTSGNQVQIVGYAKSATVLYLNPNYTFVEIT